MPLKRIARYLFPSQIPRELATKVFERDHFTCQYCGLDGRQSLANWMILTIDYVHPYAGGGPRRSDNLVTACQPCNLIKGKRKFASKEEATRYVHAKREELARQYEEQMRPRAY